MYSSWDLKVMFFRFALPDSDMRQGWLLCFISLSLFPFIFVFKGYFLILFYPYMHGCFACMYVYAPCVCSVQDQKRELDSRNWSDR